MCIVIGLCTDAWIGAGTESTPPGTPSSTYAVMMNVELTDPPPQSFYGASSGMTSAEVTTTGQVMWPEDASTRPNAYQYGAMMSPSVRPSMGTASSPLSMDSATAASPRDSDRYDAILSEMRVIVIVNMLGCILRRL